MYMYWYRVYLFNKIIWKFGTCITWAWVYLLSKVYVSVYQIKRNTFVFCLPPLAYNCRLLFCFLQIWNLNMMRDRFMAMCTIKMSERSKFDGHHVFRYELFGKDKEASVQKPGTLWLRLLHTTDMTKV